MVAVIGQILMSSNTRRNNSSPIMNTKKLIKMNLQIFWVDWSQNIGFFTRIISINKLCLQIAALQF